MPVSKNRPPRQTRSAKGRTVGKSAMPFDERVPKGWARVCLSDVAERFLNGGTPSTEETPFWNGSIPWITGADFEDQKAILGRRYITPAAVAASATNIIPKGHLLIVTRTGVGKIAQAPCDVAISQDITGMIVKEEYDCRFLYWQLNRLAGKLKRRVQGTSINGLLREDLESFPIPVPSLAEQIRIARILDGLDTVISRTRAVIEQTRRLKTALLQNLLTNGLPGMHRGFWKHPALGRIPHCWKCLSIDELATKDPRSIQSGPFGSSLLHSEFGSEGVLVIGIDNVLDGRFSIGAEHRIRPEKFDELKKYQARPSDVLITVMATVGRCCVVPENLEPALITKHVYRIAVDQSLCLPHFLMWNVLANLHVSRQLYGNAQGQTRDGLNGQSIRRLRIPIPPLEEQRVIVRTVDAIQGREDQESKNLNQLSIVKSGLSAALLDGRIRARR